ncbi:hypothetical protein CBR_g50936 [Chara braunii]|uniref:Uncharacterized protein n=1 Tax=Chara braunii TaxID=69332 RepID=A0A388M805_CHABU|nr:hypothetical protein CBR_g50936 [Chara braunii]|eukprot:GBG90592.1 hypothetical protein CBR_g50936 [Chara braunii]
MGSDPNCPKYLNQPRERKFLPNMLVEAEDAPGIWFIPDSNYNGWVFDDNLEAPDWVWHYADQDPEVKKPNVFPPADSRWQKRATGKISGNPSKITTDPLIDSRVIKEEKDKEDLLWDLEAVKEQAILHFNKDSTEFRSMLLKMEQTSTHNRTGAQTDNKRTMEKGKTQGIQEGGPKRRKTVDAQEEVVTLPTDKEGEEGRTNSGGTGSEKTSESGKGEGDNKVSESEGDSHRFLQWLRDYVEKVKREWEQAFDIRAACLKHAERSQRNGKKGMGEVGKSTNQFDVLRKVKAEELSEYTAFRYAEKKRAREQGVKDRDITAPESKDDFQDLRPKKWKSGQNQKKKNSNMTQPDFEEESARTQLEKEAVMVIAQTTKLNKLNEEYSTKFTTIAHIARDQAPLVVETAKSSRLTLMNICPSIAARYVEKIEEWQIATDVSFQIPCFEEGQNVATTLREKISTEYPLGVYDTMPSNPQIRRMHFLNQNTREQLHSTQSMVDIHLRHFHL